ncbi:MAG TPA: class I SAM-dependent methyltransferase [Pyrinomonadaceae bacterium]|nr:class I SAM-dependent methyltransferase [Pyrinomonadaceae bacterium]
MITRRSLDRIYRSVQDTLRPRAVNDYATHIPILIALARTREIRNVLEFGCGHYSTLTFLNRSAFPQVERVKSIENDPSWAHIIREIASNDARWMLELVEHEIADSVWDLDLEQFDLILIDDSKTSTQRSATIRAVARKQPQRPWILIHDYEVNEYRMAAKDFRYRYAFKTYNPETGLVSNKPIPEAKSLARHIKATRESL